MKKLFAQISGFFLLFLSLVGTTTEGQLFEFINVDIKIDLIRLAVALVLLYAGYGNVSIRTSGAILSAVGIFEMLVGIISIVDDKLLGLAPSTFTAFDMAFHLIIGLASFIIGWKNILPHNSIERKA